MNLLEYKTVLLEVTADPLTVRDMNWIRLPETHCKYFHVRSDAASMRHTVSGNRIQFMAQIVLMLFFPGCSLMVKNICTL